MGQGVGNRHDFLTNAAGFGDNSGIERLDLDVLYLLDFIGVTKRNSLADSQNEVYLMATTQISFFFSGELNLFADSFLFVSNSRGLIGNFFTELYVFTGV